MGSWGIGPFDNDDAGDALVEFGRCRSEDEFLSELLTCLQFDRGDEFDEDDEYKAIASAAVILLLLEPNDFETRNLEIINENPIRFGMPSDFKCIENKFSTADLIPLIRAARNALASISSDRSHIYGLREGDPSWLNTLSDIDSRLRSIAKR